MGVRTALYGAAASLLLGMTVGAVSDVLHPVRRKIPMLTDLILSLWITWIWLVIAFEVCKGDIRTGVCGAAAVGAICWRMALSPLIRPVFTKMWQLLWGVFRMIFVPCTDLLKKSKNFRKKLFPTGKKSVTISKDKMPK